MSKSRIVITGLMLGLLTIGGIFSAAISNFGPAPTILAADVVAATPSPAAASSSGDSKSDLEHYTALLEQNFASQLGIDKARLNSAFAAAVSSTVDQAVRDGKVDQAEADKMKTAAQGGLGAFIGPISDIHNRTGKSNGPDEDRRNDLMMAAMGGAAKTLGITSEEVGMGIKRDGKSIAQMAQAHNVTVVAVRSSMDTAAKALADSNVTAGKWTRQQADDAYAAFSKSLDGFINMVPGKPEVDTNPQEMDLMTAAYQSAAKLFGVNYDDMIKSTKAEGKTLRALAQEHNVTLDTLKSTMLSAGKTLADGNVSSSKWTREVADDAYKRFTKWVEERLAETPSK